MLYSALQELEPRLCNYSESCLDENKEFTWEPSKHCMGNSKESLEEKKID